MATHTFVQDMEKWCWQLNGHSTRLPLSRNISVAILSCSSQRKLARNSRLAKVQGGVGRVLSHKPHSCITLMPWKRRVQLGRGGWTDHKSQRLERTRPNAVFWTWQDRGTYELMTAIAACIRPTQDPHRMEPVNIPAQSGNALASPQLRRYWQLMPGRGKVSFSKCVTLVGGPRRS